MVTRFEDRRFGVEIEAYGVPAARLAAALSEAGIPCEVQRYNHLTQRVWKVVPDASIRGEYPFELVSPPLCGLEGLETLRRVASVLAQLGARVNHSCGLHVHHDARDLGVEQMRNLIRLYARMEPVLDEAMPPSRRGSRNHYCVSMRPYGEDSILARRLDEARTIQELAWFFPNRYYKLNLHAWLRHGTIEFRHHAGTINADKIVAWVIFTQILVQRAASGRVTYRERRAGYCRGNPRDLLVVDLGMHAYWRQVDALLQWAIHYIANRIRHFRRAGLAVAEEAA